MFLQVTVSEIFLLLGWVWRSDCFCSPTTFYKNCWIRQFPGLTIDLEHSQRRGAYILKVYTEATAQQCSQTCCLMKNVSCNLAVFYFEINNRSLNCLHVYCPALESCILKPWINVVLYNITPGVDPDLLVFEKLSFKDMNTRSSLNKWERHGSARVVNLEKCQNATTSSRYLLPEALSSAEVQELVTNGSNNASIAPDPIHRTASITYLGATDASLKDYFTTVPDISEREGSTSISGSTTALPTSVLTSFKMLSHMPSPAHLNSSKLLNESKGYSGRNNTEGQKSTWEEVEKGSWLLPVVLCSSLTMICCCTIFLVTGCHRKRSGRYKPRQKGVAAPRQFIRYTIVKNSF
ncbi:MANSC domain-containing protein 4 [Rhineura floridana]|uniref:MANSC domain-containing protein 4 n=1 Tax=Rhineura floridana TaxID=261503 RepID=UPI002AC86979|nr:MANSC domain-containing protein 4 [Rhineura floridana]XP_061438503.1 MANSC domain-containing protein 4 [Rhineura floridana]XP_061438504.1 MANSC domain-containing protein 4 [Rhineura floridana]XP_061438505.1 MANSC domain-containing protein 4 [Rhineura floridana]